MAFRLLQVFLLFFFFVAISAHADEDPTIKTMEEFSVYPIHEPQSSSSPSSLSVDSESLQRQIDQLSTFSDTPAPSFTRILYSEKDVLARRHGSDPELGAVATGSHIDANPYSGKYDGVVGVLGVIEAINALRSSGFKPKRYLEVILFTSEEPTCFGISCLGSRLLSGSDTLAKALKTTVDGQNVSFFNAAKSAGYAHDQENLSSVFLKKGTYSAFVELHIESKVPFWKRKVFPLAL